MLGENTLLKTACHFLLLLVGFDTPTYRKDYDGSTILVGHHCLTSRDGGDARLEVGRGMEPAAAIVSIQVTERETD